MQQIERFLLQLRAENKSAHTLDNYQRDLLSFVAFYLTQNQSDAKGDTQSSKNGDNSDQAWSYQTLMAEPQSVDWTQVGVRLIKDYVMDCVKSGLGARTLSRHLSALRSLFGFLMAQGLVQTNPALLVKAPKVPKPLPKSVDVDQTRQLLEQPIDGWHAIRDQAIFELLYSAGLRVSELVALNLTPGLDGLAAGTVQVRGKGGKMRVAFVGTKANQAIQAWLSVRGQKLQPEQSEQAVFINQLGGRLSARSIRVQLDKRTLQAGLDTKMSPHRLRHACATHVLESSGDLRAVQELLGHANLSTTQIYTKLDMQHLAKVYDQTHPRARKNQTHNE
ncbi:tyrosine recombinase XerC [Thiomicrospira microaerophila]|uniref:tyrosine recombinase XerC n=1 Tax=Thiomicrospira microaerophila TaxID=406020 RepID=UPI0005CA1F62|nr:tyrosine recombinase XerC [Thiomicrospira microaerophila]